MFQVATISNQLLYDEIGKGSDYYKHKNTKHFGIFGSQILYATCGFTVVILSTALLT